MKSLRVGSQNEKSRFLQRFARDERGAVSTWFAILLVPMLGFTFGAIKYAEMSGHRSGMMDAMDAAGLGLARQFEFEDIEACDIADGADGVDDTSTPSGQERAKLERFAREFFEENYPEFDQLYADEALTRTLDLNTDMNFVLTCSYIRINTLAYVDMGGILGRYFGVGTIPLNLTSEISLPGAGRVEIALVLDVTGSMCWEDDSAAGYPCADEGNRRIDKLRDAVDVMLDDEYMFGTNADSTNDFVRISIVPFAGAVNVDGTYAGQSPDGTRSDSVSDWMDGYGGSTPAAHYHGTKFFHAVPNGTITGKTHRDGADHTSPLSDVTAQTVNHFDLFASVGSDGSVWKGCVEARPFPLDETAAPAGQDLSSAAYDALFDVPSSVSGAVSSGSGIIADAWDNFDDREPTAYDPTEAANTKFVPYFAPDEADCASGGYGSACNYDMWGDDLFYDQKNHSMRAFMGRASGDGNDGWKDDAGFPGAIFDSLPGGDTTNNGYFVFDVYYNHWYYGSPGQRAQQYRNLVLQARASLSCENGSFPNTYDPELAVARARLGYDNCGNEEYEFRQGYVGVWDATEARYLGKYDRAGSNHDTGANEPASDAMTGQGPNADCPGPILPLTSSKAVLTSRLDDLAPNGSTNTAVGLIWGWRTLTPTMPFVQGADPNTPAGGRWKKYAVLMTDGNNTFNALDNQNRSFFGPYGHLVEDRLDIASDLQTSDISKRFELRNLYQNEVDEKTVRICHRMRESGIKVFTIGFAIEEGSNADKMLAACAVDADAYKLADNGEDLSNAFRDITEQIVELHVSG